jgi:peroxiredoxin Q/BCP
MGLFSGTNLKPGDAAPLFTLKDQTGKDVSLASLKGKRVILYFYPKADTPG